MNERDYHDHHYETEAAAIQGSPLFQRVHDRAAAEFLRSTGAGRSQRILSLGCGAGSIERRLAPHVGEVVGVDISRVAIAQAQANTRGLANASFLVCDPPSGLPEDLGKFDIVAAFAFLHHLDDDRIRDTLLGARRALRSGGLFYSSDPSRRRLIRVFTGFVRKTYERYHSPDERELDPEGLARLAAAAGLVRPAIRYTDYFLGPLAWLAPGTPGGLVAALAALDRLMLSLPLARRYASSFSLTCASSTS